MAPVAQTRPLSAAVSGTRSSKEHLGGSKRNWQEGTAATQGVPIRPAPYLTYSFVRRMICSVRGLMPVGSFSSAKLRGISSPVSRFLIMTLAKISCREGQERQWRASSFWILPGLQSRARDGFGSRCSKGANWRGNRVREGPLLPPEPLFRLEGLPAAPRGQSHSSALQEARLGRGLPKAQRRTPPRGQEGVPRP